MSGATVAAPVTAAPAPHYEFDAAFQSKIAAMSLRDAAFLQRTDALIKPDYFALPAEAQLVQMAQEYFSKHRKTPDQIIYKTEIGKQVLAKKVSKDLAIDMVKKIDELWLADISDRDYVADSVATFARHQAVIDAFDRSLSKIEKRDFTAVEKLMKDALNVGQNVHDSGYDYAAKLADRTAMRLDRKAGKLPPSGVTTGYPDIDSRLYHRGWGFKELSVLMGRAKMGKTTALIEFAINAIAAKFHVLYVSLEVSAAIIAERADANIAEQIMMEMGDHIHDINKKVKDFTDKAAKFAVHEFPSGSFKTSDLRRLIEHYKARGQTFDLVVVDYADLMAPEHYTESTTENSKSVYVTLRGLAMEEGFAVLTATQTNREGAKVAVAKMEHVAEDFNKIRIADVVISINKTDDEAANKQARLFFAACRNQASGFTIRIEQDTDRMKFIKKVLGVE